MLVLRGLREAGFTVSPKTTLVTTDRSLSTRLVQKYRASGLLVHSAMSAADLGIDRGFAARRRISKHTRRWKSALFRAKKICRLARNLTSARTTRMLAVTGRRTSATYSRGPVGHGPLATGSPPNGHGECSHASQGRPVPHNDVGVRLASQLVLSSSAHGSSWMLAGTRIVPHVGRTRMAMSGARTITEGWSTSAPSSQL